MKLLIVDTFYGPYLQRLYAEGNVASRPWAEQHKAHFAGGFGTGNAYSHGLGLLGVPAIEIVANSTLLQRAWALEHRPELLQLQDEPQQLLAILEAQIRWWQPTVLYVQDINWLPAPFLKHVKPLLQQLVGQNACPLAANLDLSAYDLLLTSLPHYVGRFRKQGLDAAYFPIGFDQRLLQRHNTHGPRPHALTFVGGLGGYHSQGTQMLEAIAKELPLQVWGYGGQQLPAGSSLKQRWQGEAWAEQMYGLLADSQITINRHIDIAESYANNMRLYEATGMGACLVTDAKANLATLFEPDDEVVTYETPEEAISKIQDLCNHPAEVAKIAQSGQQRTLREHSYCQRMQQLVELLKRFNNNSGNSYAIPRKQQIVVSFDSTTQTTLPASIHRALSRNHQDHAFTLLSNAQGLEPSLKGLPRWLAASNSNGDSSVDCCFDALEPSTLITIKADRSSWQSGIKQKAMQRQITVAEKGELQPWK